MLNKIDNPLNRCEVKFASDERSFSGYASVFESVDSYGDTILKGAFNETLENRKRPVKFLFGHNPGRPMGVWKELYEDDSGLVAKGEFTEGNSDAENIRASLKHGAIDGLSIGFRIPKGGSEEKEGGGRIISKAELVEVSIVSMPAEDNARVDLSTVKSEIETIETLRQAEAFLRDVGMFQPEMAKQFLSQLKPVIQREAESDQQIKAIHDGLSRVANSADELRRLVA